MTYDEAVEYLLTFADFERSGRFQDRPDVKPVLALLGALGDPHIDRPTVHVAGSKGKGSVAAMIESCLRAAGFTTGLYTSPHLHDYTERIALNGESVSRDEFASLAVSVREAVEEVAPALGDRRLVTFDLLTAMGFLAFRKDDVDVQVIEVGLGGRVDSTNVIDTKDIAVITPISLEHTAILGGTIEKIAREKAGIITSGCTVILAPQEHAEASGAVHDVAGQVGAHVVDVAAEYEWSVPEHGLHAQTVRIDHERRVVDARLPLLGRHQADNAATAVAVLDALHLDERRIGDDAIIAGLANVRWPGRFEVLQEQSLVIADGAHNRDSARRFVEALREYARADRATFVIGSLGDKNVNGLAEEIAPVAERVFAVRSQHPRAMDPALLVEAFEALGVPAQACGSVREGVDNAMAVTPASGVICLIGSLFVAAEGREYLLGPAGE